MSSYVHAMVINVPIETVWRFAHSIDEWSLLIPGYIEHEIINNRDSEWIFLSSFGIIKKKIHLQAKIKQWIEFNKISVNIIGLSDRFSGTCLIETKSLTKDRTYLSFRLTINTEGTLVKMLKPMIKTNNADWANDFKWNVEKVMKEFEARKK
jgi:carbon monoxide dehydrogenase subunit G